jgi:predicted acetylornithine/succinylornithine family transaminase
MPTLDSDALIASARKRLLSNYNPAPVVMSRGKGCRIWDTNDRSYLDMAAGIAVCTLGHGHAGLAGAIAAQASKLHHVSNLFFIEQQIHYAEALGRRAFQGRAFFCNSGAEANEAALKLARRYQVVTRNNPGRTEWVACEGSFHGRTFGSLSVTGQAKYRQGFGPLVPDVRFIPFGDLAAARDALGDRTCAFIIEPIQGEGGVRLPPAGYLKELRSLTTDRGVVLIFDEVQTGVGRTGTFYAFEQEDAVPDIVTLGKGLAGGVPMGAMLANDEIGRAFEPGTHASTFGGNPLACAAALAVDQALDEGELLARSTTVGAYLGEALRALAARHQPKTTGARGRGLLQGLVLEGDAAPVVVRAREKGLLVTAAGGNIVRLSPPLIVTEAEIDQAIVLLDAALTETL